jgi:3-hydroxyisobutyrate dehydrogenase-like beta-hydroxyacid dehydrogenase
MIVAFLGLGTMGVPMVKNLVAKGHTVHVYNRTRAKAEALAASLAGLTVHDTPASAARAAEVVVSCVSDGPDVEAVHLGPGGTVEGAQRGVVVIDCSTIAAEVARRVAASLSAKGVLFLDAPVSGGQKGAIEGTLTYFIGGEAAAIERARPVLEAMGKRITLLGPSGAGQLGKAVNQIIVALNLTAVSEGLAFAQRAGLPLEALHAALSGGAAQSWALDVLGKKMIARDFAPAFAIEHQQKDLAIVLASARAQGTPLPGVGLVHQLLSSLEAQGRGKDGTQALLTLYEALSGPR